MRSPVESLNLAVAAALIVYEAARQRGGVTSAAAGAGPTAAGPARRAAGAEPPARAGAPTAAGPEPPMAAAAPTAEATPTAAGAARRGATAGMTSPSLFDEPARETRAAADTPLAERMRPRSFDELVGQDELVGRGRPLRQAIERDTLRSIILWGPPGSGKTTLARLIADVTTSKFVAFSAVLSGIKEIRGVLAGAEAARAHGGRRTILFVDEIHRFNKAQQDAFLPASRPATSSSSAPPPRTPRSR